MEQWLYNVDIMIPGQIEVKSEWAPGVSYSDVLLRYRAMYPDLGADCFLVRRCDMSWDDWIEETQKSNFN